MTVNKLKIIRGSRTLDNVRKNDPPLRLNELVLLNITTKDMHLPITRVTDYESPQFEESTNVIDKSVKPKDPRSRRRLVLKSNKTKLYIKPKQTKNNSPPEPPKATDEVLKKTPEKNISCNICHEEKKKNQIEIFSCKHDFCFECLDSFRNFKCPVCRKDIEKEMSDGLVDLIRERINSDQKETAREIEEDDERMLRGESSSGSMDDTLERLSQLIQGVRIGSP